MTDPCVDIQDRLSAYLDGDMEPARRDEIAAHLAVCKACRRELDALAALDTLLPAWREPAVPDALSLRFADHLAALQPPPRRWSWRALLHPQLAWVAAACAAVLLAVMVQRIPTPRTANTTAHSRTVATVPQVKHNTAAKPTTSKPPRVIYFEMGPVEPNREALGSVSCIQSLAPLPPQIQALINKSKLAHKPIVDTPGITDKTDPGPYIADTPLPDTTAMVVNAIAETPELLPTAPPTLVADAGILPAMPGPGSLTATYAGVSQPPVSLADEEIVAREAADEAVFAREIARDATTAWGTDAFVVPDETAEAFVIATLAEVY